MEDKYMEEIFEENLSNIRHWIDSGDYKEANPTYDKNSGYTVVDYVAEYFLPDPEDEDEMNISEIPLSVYIDKENEFKLEFNQPLFNWYFKGYETEENTSIVEKFMEYVKKKGLKLNP